MITDLRVLIVGGGIGGLAAAGRLHALGARVTVVEQSPEWRPLGAGLVLSANALAVLDALGLGATVRARSLPFASMEILSADGAVLQRITRRGGPQRYEAARGIHRAALHEVLLNGAAGVDVRLGTSVHAMTHDERAVHVTFSDAREDVFDLVVGADGVHSHTRHLVFAQHEAEVRYAGYTCWRTVMPNRTDITAALELWGRGKRVGLVPLPDGQLYVFLTANSAAGERDPSHGANPVVAARFREFTGPAGPVITAIAERDEVRLMRHDITELSRQLWVRGRIALLGDAGHATTPNLGQGAGMALEDALSLVLALRTHETVRSALTHYAATRAHRVAQIVQMSRRVGEMGQWVHPVARALRHAAMRLTPAWVGERTMRLLVDPGVVLSRRAVQ